jgi:CTP:molybdopterin cytidylyltransferase MocA
MLQLSGDSGARALLKRHMDDVMEVATTDDGVLRDFDTEASLAQL